MGYIILADSCCDYPTDGTQMEWLGRVPLTITLEGREYVDDRTLDCDGLLDDMDRSTEAPKSACPSPQSFFEVAGEAQDVYIVTLSERLSGSCASARAGAEMLRAAGRNAHVFNSRSASAGEVAVCMKIRELAEEGLSFDEVVERGEAFVRTLSTLFALETLEVLRKNGRLTHLQSIVTAALKLKLIMGGDEQGSIALRGKALTMRRALNHLVERVQKSAEKLDFKTCCLVISQCGCPERAEQLRDMILAKCPFREVVICRTGGISTIYASRGGVVVAY